MNFRKNILALSVTTSLLGLTACGVTPQDEGTGLSNQNKVSGVAVDGYLANAVVYADTNENNKLDIWEQRALTDKKGYFSYNPVSDVNYCESTNKDHAKYCLKAPIGYDEVVIRITKGLDLTTMEPFTGTLSMRMNVSGNVITSPQMTSPITGLLAHMDADQITAFLSEEGITAEQAAKDFLDYSDTTLITDEAERRTLLSLALKIHKVSDVIARRLSKKFDQNILANPNDTSLTAKGFFGVSEGVSNDGSVLVYKALANEISGTTDASAVLASTSKMAAVVTNAWNAINDVIQEHNDRKLANQTDTEGSSQNNVDGLFIDLAVDTTAVSAIAADAVELAAVADGLFASGLTAIVDDMGTAGDTSDDVVTSPESEDVASRIKALDIVATLMRKGKDRNSAETMNAISLAGDATYLMHLRSKKVDVAGMKDKFLSNAGGVTAADADYSSRQGFGNLLQGHSGGTNAGFTVANEQGMGGNSLNISEGQDNVAVSFLSDDPEADNGTVSISADFADGIFASSGDSTTGDSQTELTGTWEQLDEYTMLMNIDVAGVTQPVIIKPTLDENGNEAYYFDMGGEQGIWMP